jgi:hypothetical protein
MDIGPLGGYRLPPAVRDAFGTATAQELADKLGVTKKPTPELAGEADAAYQSLRAGDAAPARALLVDRLGVSESSADSAIAALPRL